VASGDVDVPFECPDQATYERALAASACAVDAIEHSGEERVRAALCEAGAPFRRPDGSYRLENRLRYVIARRWSPPRRTEYGVATPGSKANLRIV
jgi:hypothetical protein